MLKVTKFASLDDMNNFLQGAVVGGDIGSGPFYYLDGTVLKLTTPAATCTFATAHNSQQEPLTLQQVVAAINASAIGSTVIARVNHGRIVLVQKSLTTGVVLASEGAGSTANHLLGFDPAGMTGKVFAAPGGSAPALVDVSAIDLTNCLVVTNE